MSSCPFGYEYHRYQFYCVVVVVVQMNGHLIDRMDATTFWDFWDQCSLLLKHEILKKLVTYIGIGYGVHKYYYLILLNPVYFGDLVTKIHYFSPLNGNISAQLRTIFYISNQNLSTLRCPWNCSQPVLFFSKFWSFSFKAISFQYWYFSFMDYFNVWKHNLNSQLCSNWASKSLNSTTL